MCFMLCCFVLSCLTLFSFALFCSVLLCCTLLLLWVALLYFVSRCFVWLFLRSCYLFFFAFESPFSMFCLQLSILACCLCPYHIPMSGFHCLIWSLQFWIASVCSHEVNHAACPFDSCGLLGCWLVCLMTSVAGFQGFGFSWSACWLAVFFAVWFALCCFSVLQCVLVVWFPDVSLNDIVWLLLLPRHIPWPSFGMKLVLFAPVLA